MPYAVTPLDAISEAGRHVLAAELNTIQSHLPAVAETADMTGVHESRKAIRRSYTAFRVFGPYFEPGALKRHRRGLKKLMRRLAPSRDAAVMLLKLDAHLGTGGSDEGLQAVRARLSERLDAADAALQAYLARPKPAKRLAAYRAFLDTEGAGALATAGNEPWQVRHLAPSLLYSRWADVRVYEGRVADASLAELHALRIRLKELRYTVEFFEEVLGPTYVEAHGVLKEMLTLLGDLNDANVALSWLAGEARVAADARLEAGIARYEAVQRDWIARDRAAFAGIWATLMSAEWRGALALAVAAL